MTTIGPRTLAHLEGFLRKHRLDMTARRPRRARKWTVSLRLHKPGRRGIVAVEGDGRTLLDAIHSAVGYYIAFKARRS